MSLLNLNELFSQLHLTLSLLVVLDILEQLVANLLLLFQNFGFFLAHPRLDRIRLERGVIEFANRTLLDGSVQIRGREDQVLVLSRLHVVVFDGLVH